MALLLFPHSVPKRKSKIDLNYKLFPMEYFRQTLMGFVEILMKTYKIFSTNGKLIPFITLLFLLIQSIFFLLNFFSVKPLVIHLARKLIISLLLVGDNPTANHASDFTKLVTVLEDDAQILVGLEWIFLLVSSFTSLFFAVVTILASSATYAGKSINVKELLSLVWKPWIRAFVTVFYITLLELGYIFMASSFMLPFVLILGVDLAKSFSYIIIFVLASIFYCYLSVVWNLALAVSVMEEKYSGIEALGKAGQLVKGLKLQGFLTNLAFGILYCVAFQVIRKMNEKQSEAVGISIALFAIDFMLLVKMFLVIAYTVLYHECKKSHGEEIEVQKSIEYTKVPAGVPLIIRADLP